MPSLYPAQDIEAAAALFWGGEASTLSQGNTVEAASMGLLGISPLPEVAKV